MKNKKRFNRRIRGDRFFYYSVITITCIAVLPLFAIIILLLGKGYKQISFDFITEIIDFSNLPNMAQQPDAIIPGGIVNGITGTFYMVGLASLVAIPIGILCGIFLYEGKHVRFCNFVRFIVELIQGLPSIIIGVVVYGLVVMNTHHYSALAGSVALCIMMLPLITRSTEESLKMLPISLKEAGLALGVPYVSVVFRVLLPASFSGLFTGILLAISRVLGETAPLLITAVGSDFINWDLNSPTSAIPLLVWKFYNDSNLVNLIWSSSLLLLVIVLVLNLLSKYLSKKWRIA